LHFVDELIAIGDLKSKMEGIMNIKITKTIISIKTKGGKTRWVHTIIEAIVNLI